MLATGTLLDQRYELIEPIGSGGFGAVYKARQDQLDRLVAIKILNINLLHEHGGVARFEREARLISGLRHKNIVAVYGYGVWQQTPYMAMEYVDGKSLDQIINSSPMPVDRTLAIMREFFVGLAAAHSKGVVHRDLKTANLLILQNDEVKIIDFGLAKLMPGYGILGQKLTETGYTLGTCNYMPPEQALGQPVDHRSDIYSAGCIMYEMLTGHVPFEADSNVLIMMHHINDEPKPLSDTMGKSAQTKALMNFLSNCMAKEPTDRYSSCEEALQALENISSGRDSLVTPHMVRSRRRPRLGLKAALAALLGACIFGIGYALVVDRLNADNSAMLYQNLRESSDPNDYAMLAAIATLDEKDHRLRPNDRLDLLFQLFRNYRGTPKDDGMDRLIERIIIARGPLNAAPPECCKSYEDGEFARLIAGRSVADYSQVALGLAETSMQRRSLNGAYAKNFIEFACGDHQRAVDMAEKASSTWDWHHSFLLTDLISKGEFARAVSIAKGITDEHARNLWLTRIYWFEGNYRECQICATLTMTHEPPYDDGDCIAARYRWLAKRKLGQAPSMPNDLLMQELGTRFPAIMPAYPMQMMENKLWTEVPEG